jgi:DNA-directed RNA polymerase specialized sigma24 family protein
MYGFREFLTNNPEDQQIIGMYLSRPDMPISEISQATGKSQGEIYRILHNHDVKPNRLKTNHQKVMSLADVGWNVHEIAQLTGYTTRNVRYILSKKEQ